MKNYYHILGIPEDASPEFIKAAFKLKAVQYHPDKHAGNVDMEERFKEINEAYQVLSNPYKKANHDLELQYLRFTATRQVQDCPANPHQRPPHYRPRPFYRQPPISRKDNNKATLYAFALTACIAVLVMLVREFYDLYLERKYEALLKQRRESFETAQGLYADQKIRESLLLLSDLSPFKPEEADMFTYQNKIMEDVIFLGEANFERQNFAEAVRYYELVEQFSPYRPNGLRARLALSYRQIKKPEQSLLLFKELLEAKYEVVSTLNQMAEVYHHELHDPQKAKEYLELAREVAIKEYISTFGKAYALFIHQKYIPSDHFYLFENLASLYNELEEAETSIGVTNWMKRVWPDSAQSFVLAGQSYEILNKRALACDQYIEAKGLGHSAPLPLLCR